MKKILIFVLFFLGAINVYAKDNSFEVDFSDCVDGDTAKFIYKNKEITARFLAIDTPETVHPNKEVEPYGKEASNFTCNSLKKAKEIILEYDKDSDKKDKYDRYLVWVFVDGKLLQKELIKKGYASVAYLYGDYKYTDELEKAEQTAEEKKVGIWSNNEDSEKTEESKEENKVKEETKETKNDKQTIIEKYKEYIILIGALILVYAFNLKSKKKIKTKLKNKIKSDIKKKLK